MDRRSFITTLAGDAALAHATLAGASTTEAFSAKTRPVDTMNRVDGWTNGAVDVIEIKGVRIGEGPSQADRPDDLEDGGRPDRHGEEVCRHARARRR